MAKPFQSPLNWQLPIVDARGFPTPEFIRRWMQQNQINGVIPDLSTPAAVSAVLDEIYSTPGGILVRGSSQWGGLASPADATKFLNGTNPPSWAVPPQQTVTENEINLSDVLTDNVSTARHGFAPKLPNDATKYLDGTGAYSVPSGGGGGGSYISIVQAKPFAIDNNTPSITFATAPTAGNMILALGARWNTTISLAGGWFEFYRNLVGSTCLVFAAYKIAAAGESATQQPYTTSSGWMGVLYELSGAAFSNMNGLVYAQDQSGTTLTVNGGSPAAKSTLIGAMMSSGKNNSGGTTLTGATATTAFTNDGGSNNGGPHTTIGYAQTFASKSGFSVTGTYSASGTSNQTMALVFGASV